MLKILITSLAVAGLLLVAACGDDDDISSPTPSGESGTPTFGDGRTTPPTASITDAPDDDDQKTAPPTPADGNGGEETPAPTAPGPTPSPPPTASVGTPAPQASPSIVAAYEGQIVNNVACQYNPNTAQATCGDRIFAPDPPMVGQDITCQLWIVGSLPVLINCTAIEPFRTVFYSISQ